MFKVDSENMTIYLTRGDTDSIIFSAKDQDGNQFHPTTNDCLVFSVAKKYGDEPLIEIYNKMTGIEEDFWVINILPEHTENLNFGKYAFDVQLEMRDDSTGNLTAINTIIGKTDEISPQFILWGEVSQESE